MRMMEGGGGGLKERGGELKEKYRINTYVFI